MIGRMKINTFTFRVSLDRAPYRKSACVFESRFLLPALRAVLGDADAGGQGGERLASGAARRRP